MTFFPKVRVRTCYLSQDILISGHSRSPVCSFRRWPLLRVIQGHIRSNSFFCLKLLIKWRCTLGMVSICFFCKDASTDIQYDPLGSTRDLTWPDIKFWHCPFKVDMEIFRRVSTRGTRCCQNYYTSLLSSKLIYQKINKRYFDLSWPS